MKNKIRKSNKNTTRFCTPFTIKCTECSQYIFKNKRHNTIQEEVVGGDYYGVKVYRFIFKCPGCKKELSIKTDPKNGQYVTEMGCMKINESFVKSKKILIHKNEDITSLQNDIKKLYEIEEKNKNKSPTYECESED